MRNFIKEMIGSADCLYMKEVTFLNVSKILSIKKMKRGV